MSDKSKIEWTDASWNPIKARWFAPTNDGGGKERIGWHCEKISSACAHCYAEEFNQRLGTQLPYVKESCRRTVIIGGPNAGQDWKGEHTDYREERGDAEVFLDEKTLLQPLKWKRPRKIFVCSMTDLFGEWVTDEMLDRIFAVMALCPQHTFQVLTKRPERMNSYLSAARAHPVGLAALGVALEAAAQNPKSNVGEGIMLQGNIAHLQIWPLPNVWLGVTAENQEMADKRIPLLLATPAALRFVSIEPMLEHVDLRQWQHSYGCGCGWGGDEPLSYCNECGWRGRDAYYGEDCPECKSKLADYHACPECDGHSGDLFSFGPNSLPSINWVIAGGESGAHARPSHPDWFRSLREQCAAAGVPFLFKQWGEWGQPTDTLSALDWPYHHNYDRTFWFDGRACMRPIEAGWSDKYHDGAGALQPPPFDLWKTPEYLDQVKRCPQAECRQAEKCEGNKARAAVTRVGKKAAGRLLDGIEHNAFPEVRS